MNLRSRFLVAAITLAAFVLRMMALDGVPARWDEGWSAALAAQPAADILWITAADVHPPMYYLLLGLWQQLLGVNLFANRFLSVIMALPAIPLIAHVLRAQVGRNIKLRHQTSASLAAIFSAALLAWFPLHVYYSQVVRMYALAPTLVLMAFVGGLGLLQSKAPSARLWKFAALFVAGSAGAMLTLYHAAWSLAALGLFVMLVLMGQRRGLRLLGFICATLAAVALFAPWGLYAIPKLLARASDEATRNTNAATPLIQLLQSGLLELNMAREYGWWTLALMGVIVLMGLLLALLRGRVGWRAAHLTLPLLVILFTLVGVAFAARNWAFNARMLICAGPAVALLLGWALGQMPLLMGGVCLLALGAMYADTSTHFVYAKTLEVSGEYSPHQIYERIAPRVRPDDVIIVNVLSTGGFYLYDQVASPNLSPELSFALTWDPVIEPELQWQARLRTLEDATNLLPGGREFQHYRFWLVLYNGLYRDNGALRGYMDSNYYPVLGEWGEDNTFFGLYGRPPDEWAMGETTRWGQLLLSRSNCPASHTPGDVLPVSLTWRAVAPLKHQYKVFVHALDADGTVVGQHDAMPLNDLRPFNTLPPGEFARDNHGLLLDENAMLDRDLRIVLGLYDPTTGNRIADDDGREQIEICKVPVGQP